MKSFPYAFALITVAGCAVDPTPTTDPTTDPKHDEYGTVVQLPHGELDDAEPDPVGIAYATPAQRSRMIEAAIGGDADWAVARTESLRNGFCPVEVPIDGGYRLEGGCNRAGHKVSGTATVVTSGAQITYKFDHFDVTMDGIHESFDGTVALSDPTSRPSLRATRLVAIRSFAGDSVDAFPVSSNGRWANVGTSVMGLSVTPTAPSQNIWISAHGIGAYRVTSLVNLVDHHAWVRFDGGQGGGIALEAATVGNEACWTMSASPIELPESCFVESDLIMLDPR